MKTHIPLDRVPFHCSLCSFRCQDKDTLVAHIHKYKRHRDEEIRSGTPNYSAILKKAENPITVGDRDTVALTKEESIRWHSRHMLSEEPLGDLDAIFQDEDDETVLINGMVMPSWLATPRSPAVSIPRYVPTPMNPQQPRFAELTVPLPAPTVQSNDLLTINAAGLEDLLGEVEGLSTVQTTSNPGLHTPVPSTPCQDERSTVDLLPGLLCVNQEDPLFQEAQGLPTSETADEPAAKRARTEAPVTQTDTTIADVLTKGFKDIVEALNSNTRAIRCQGKTLDQVVSELARIERKIAQLDRNHYQKSGKENQPTKALTKNSTRKT